jgi:hypothetical protein
MVYFSVSEIVDKEAIMIPAALLQLQFKAAHDFLEGTLGAITAEAVNRVPDAELLSSIGAQYLHILTTEDVVFNVVLTGGAPLLATTFAGKIGASEPPHLFTWHAWGRSHRVDLAAARADGQAVYAATDSYLGNVSPESLDTIIDLTSIGFGSVPRASLITLALQNIYTHTGEISTLKGLQGLKGYPI